MSFLIEFKRKEEEKEVKDISETVANVCLRPLRLTCGKTVEVSYSPAKTYQEMDSSSKIARVFYALMTLVLVPFILLGMLAALRSGSYKSLHQDFASQAALAAKAVLTKRPLKPATPSNQDDQLFERYAGWLQSKLGKDIPQVFLIHSFREAEARYGTKEFSEKLFSAEHEKEVLDAWAKATTIAEETKTPTQLTETRPVVETEATVIQIEKHIEAWRKEPRRNVRSRHLTAILDHSDELRRQINAQALRNLRATLNREVGPDLAETILADWDLIGRDIQENTAVLSLERKDKIVLAAKKAKENHAQLEAIFDKLKKDLARDLPVQEAYIFRRYPQLSELLAAMPESKTQMLHQIMAKAFLQKELANPTAFVGPIHEKRVVGALGFSLEHYDEREKIHEALVGILQPLLEQAQASAVPIEQLKQQIEETASRTRLLAAGVPEDQVAAVQELTLLYRETQTRWNQDIAPFSDLSKSNIHLEIARRFIANSLSSRNKNLVISLLKWVLTQNKEKLLACSPQNMRSLWNEILARPDRFNQLAAKCSDKSSVEKASRWFSTYQDLFIHEFSQGENDSGEILGDGVCYALVHRLARRTLLYPELSVGELRIDTILPSDRLLQAFASMNLDWGKKTFALPDSVKRQQGVRDLFLFDANNPQEIAIGLATHAGDLKSSQGGLMLLRDRHATFLCIDEAHQRFFFFDPNWGTIVFKREPNEELEQLAVRMAICYNELYEWAYDSKAPLIAALQLVKTR